MTRTTSASWTGFPFEQGDANIWRVVPGQAPAISVSGLTNLTDLAFAADGSLYAVEIASTGLLNGPIGALVRITPGGSQHTTVAGGLFAPYGVALTDGAPPSARARSARAVAR